MANKQVSHNKGETDREQEEMCPAAMVEEVDDRVLSLATCLVRDATEFEDLHVNVGCLDTHCHRANFEKGLLEKTREKLPVLFSKRPCSEPIFEANIGDRKYHDNTCHGNEKVADPCPLSVSDDEDRQQQ